MHSARNVGGTSGIYTVGGEFALFHYGIKGQKWGVRRFQNTDGSLTSAGRERYGVKQTFTERAHSVGERIGRAARGFVETRRLKEQYGKDTVKAMKAATKGKRLSEMTDAEIRKKIDRLHLENQLLSEIKTKNQTSIDIHNASKSKTTWYSKYGHDLVKEAIRDVANSNVLASSVRANADARANVDKAKIEDARERKKNQLQAETDRIKNSEQIRETATTARLKNRADSDNARRKNDQDHERAVEEARIAREERERDYYDRQREKEQERLQRAAERNPSNFITLPDGNVIPLMEIPPTERHRRAGRK